MFIVNNLYTKNDIYQILNVPEPSRDGAWDTGYRKYKDEFYLFANIGVAGRAGQNHNNHWQGDDLIWYSKQNANPSQPSIREMLDPNRTVHIFTRKNSRDPFTYQGLGKVKESSGARPVEVIWSFSHSDWVDVKGAWVGFLKATKGFLTSGEIYRSPKQGKQYKISDVTSDHATVLRFDTAPRTQIKITYTIFAAAISKFNASNGVLPKTGLYDLVAVETTLVWFLPLLDWDEDIRHIIFSPGVEEEYPPAISKQLIKEASHDTDFKLLTKLLRVRRGQNKLRENLFLLYRGQCCISGTVLKDTLHACHIIPHSLTGDNSSTNALLLRSDIHDLFDVHLVGIDPDTLKIVIKHTLRNSEYYKFNGVKLAERTDKLSPDMAALRERWKYFLKT